VRDRGPGPTGRSSLRRFRPARPVAEGACFPDVHGDVELTHLRRDFVIDVGTRISMQVHQPDGRDLGSMHTRTTHRIACCNGRMWLTVHSYPAYQRQLRSLFAPIWLDPSFSSSSFLACTLISGRCGSRPLPSGLMGVKLHWRLRDSVIDVCELHRPILVSCVASQSSTL